MQPSTQPSSQPSRALQLVVSFSATQFIAGDVTASQFLADAENSIAFRKAVVSVVVSGIYLRDVTIDNITNVLEESTKQQQFFPRGVAAVHLSTARQTANNISALAPGSAAPMARTPQLSWFPPASMGINVVYTIQFTVQDIQDSTVPQFAFRILTNELSAAVATGAFCLSLQEAEITSEFYSLLACYSTAWLSAQPPL